ncbi:Hypothetical protein LUCI_4309 [Lucifera butyrica]|uniref:PPM-type phosphatase domain-containing protein n=1 Tax=Lucifera butyrica TaxID=1351585 RepID=A0A498RG09_9FIRM|nr:PP2C family serine/threonine-protein phosphatase [Lucifera butyrica]VBB09023.1 Hypothetical protein LUCI_4309 [Lucifera butyrica]
MKKINAKFNAAFLSEAGSFLQNKDYFAFVELDDLACYVIADGIDDDLDQGSANLAVASIIRQFNEKPSMKKRDIKNWLKTANQELLSMSKTMRLKASLLVVVSDYAGIVYGLAGNTRLHLLRDGSIVHQSIDQSLSNELFEQGKISKDKIAVHLERNNLYCYLGQPEGFNPTVSGRIKLLDGDILNLYTRGIWENIDEGELADAAREAKEPQEVLNNVEDLLLSRQPAKLANYTLATLFIDRTYKDPGRRRLWLKRAFYAAIPVLILIAGLLIYFHISEAHRREQLDAMKGHVRQAQTLTEENNYARAAEEYKAALNIAQNLKLKQEQKDLAQYYDTIGLIVAGDTALQRKDFGQAAEKYKAALDASYFADHLGEAYIIKQQRQTGDYMRVIELLQTGDQKAEQKDLNGARGAYLEAKIIASRLYFIDGRKEAADKLAKLSEQLTTDDKKAKEQEGVVYEQQGDRMAQTGDYQGAVTMLNIASGLYDQGGKPDKTAAVQRKIVAIEDKMSSAEKAAVQQNVLAEAAKYEKEGDSLLSDKDDVDGALDQYSLAMSLYEENGRQDKSALLQAKIDQLNARKKNAQTLDLQRKAMDMEREGDLDVAKNQYDDARNCYAFAQQLYGNAGLSSNVTMVQKKIDSLDQKNTSFEQQKSKADAYVAEADARTQKGEYTQAQYLYLLAKDIYQRLGLQNETNEINEKLRLLDKLSQGAA